MKKLLLLSLVLLSMSSVVSASSAKTFAKCDVKNSDEGVAEFYTFEDPHNQGIIFIDAEFNGFHKFFMDSEFAKIRGEADRIIQTNNQKTFRAKGNLRTIKINKTTGEGSVSMKDIYGYIFSDTYTVELENCQFLGFSEEAE